MAATILAGAAHPVQTSNQTPSGGPAIPIAVVTAGAAFVGPYQPIVEVADNRPRQGGAAMPVVVGIGSGVAIIGDPLPVYVVSGSLNPTPPVVLPDVASATLLLNLQADTGVTTSTASFVGTGTITQLLTAVTGIGTAFLSEIVVGDRITSSGSTINGIVQSITDNTNLTLDTSVTVGGGLSYNIIPQSGTARVTIWADQSSGGHNFTQSGLARPSKQTISGYAVIMFNRLNKQWMLGTDFADNLDSFAVFVVRANWDGPIILKILSDNCDDPGSTGWSVYGRTISLLTDTSNQIYQTAAVVNAKAVWSHMVISRTELHEYMNSALVDDCADGGCVSGAGVGNYSTTEPVRLGADGSGIGVCDLAPMGELYAVMLYAPAPNASDRAAIEAWLAARYGITL